jgi:ADP-heptose:LPS heptosyltransferase
LKKSLFLSLLFRPFKIKRPRIRPEKPSKILVIRQDNRIGNLILLTPFLKKCSDCFSGATIDVVVGGFFGETIRNNPGINTLHTYNQLKFIRYPWLFINFIFKLRRLHYDIVFDMKTDLSFNNTMVTLLCGAKYRAGFSSTISQDYYDMSVPINYALYEAENLIALLNAWTTSNALPPILYIPQKDATERAAKILQDFKLPLGRIIAIHTGGRGAKRIPLDDFLSLGKRLQEEKRSVLFIFGPDELEYMSRFKTSGFICINPKRVEDFGGFLPHLLHFISCDTGPMHMAAGAGVNTHSIFVNSSPERYAPRGEKHKVVRNISDIVITNHPIQTGITS